MANWEGPEVAACEEEVIGSVKCGCLDEDGGSESAPSTKCASSGPLEVAWESRFKSFAILSLPG